MNIEIKTHSAVMLFIVFCCLYSHFFDIYIFLLILFYMHELEKYLVLVDINANTNTNTK